MTTSTCDGDKAGLLSLSEPKDREKYAKWFCNMFHWSMNRGAGEMWQSTFNLPLSIIQYTCRNEYLQKGITKTHRLKVTKTKSVALSPQANYTDWTTATCRRNLVHIFVDRGVSRGQRGGSPTVVNLSFLDRSRYFFFQVAPHLSSQGLSGHRSRPTATQKI
jgi:hypothetical protein